MIQEFFELPNVGIASFACSQEQLAPLYREVVACQENPHQFVNHSEHLAGNLARQYLLRDSRERINELLMPLCQQFNLKYGYESRLNWSCKDDTLVLDDVWVNYQYASEFQPLHNHQAVYSFVIWLEIPFYDGEEKQLSFGILPHKNLAGHFVFSYNSILGEDITYSVMVDKKFENKGLLFPSSLSHMVYPFLTPNRPRISVSGNIKFKSWSL